MAKPEGTQYSQMIAPEGFKAYEQQGVVDKSDAIRTMGVASFIEDAGKMGIDAWKGKSMADLEKNQEAVIDEYMSANHPKETQALNFKIDALDTSNDTFTSLSPVEQEHQNRINQMQDAFSQGAMTPDEFQTRILSTTKDAVNKAPGFYPELVDHSRKVLELSGMAGILKEDEKTLKSKQAGIDAYSKNVLDAAEKNNIPVDYARGSDMLYLADINQKVAAVVERKQYADALQAVVSDVGAHKTIDVENFINSGVLPKAVLGTLETMNGQITQLATMATNPQSYAEFVLASTQMANKAKRDYQLLASRFIDDPRVKSQMEFLTGQLDATTKAFATFKSGDEAAKYLANQKQIFMDADTMSFYRTTGISPTASSFMTNLLNNQTIAAMATGGKLPIVTKIVDYLEKGIDGATLEKNMQGKSLALDVFTGALTSPPDATTQAIVNNTPSVVLKDTSDTTKYTQNQKYAFQTEYIKKLANPMFADAIKAMPDGSRQDALTSLNDYATLTKNTMFKEMNELGKKGKKIELDVLPDGRLHLRGDVSSDFVNKYVTRINDSIGAMANLMGTDNKTAAEQYFYPQFFKEEGAKTITTPIIRSQSITPTPLERTDTLSTSQEVPSVATQHYLEAQNQAQKQREEIYTAIDNLQNGITTIAGKKLDPVKDLISNGWGLLGDVIVDIATLPNKITWDMEHYHKTGELRRKGDVSGYMPNTNK